MKTIRLVFILIRRLLNIFYKNKKLSENITPKLLYLFIHFKHYIGNEKLVLIYYFRLAHIEYFFITIYIHFTWLVFTFYKKTLKSLLYNVFYTH